MIPVRSHNTNAQSQLLPPAVRVPALLLSPINALNPSAVAAAVSARRASPQIAVSRLSTPHPPLSPPSPIPLIQLPPPPQRAVQRVNSLVLRQTAEDVVQVACGAGSTARATRTAAGGGAGAVDTGGITSPPPSAPATATGTPSATLGKGAKAGIGIGVTLSAVLLVSALTYFILAHRRNRNAAITAGAVTADADAASQSNHTPQTGPSPTAPRSDHLGPVAQTGPFSQRGGASGVAWVVEMRGTAVPVEPQGPDDIAMAVEIAESNPITKVKDEGSSGSPLKPAGDRFELE
ncbi:MAG: hypothetical protein M1827_006373 [Pycnora praestabilis]|nr:MAG: hypothetical protein M1827_006373 [Pycnora praestabilis]